jgi:hypothetical protein
MKCWAYSSLMPALQYTYIARLNSWRSVSSWALKVSALRPAFAAIHEAESVRAASWKVWGQIWEEGFRISAEKGFLYACRASYSSDFRYSNCLFKKHVGPLCMFNNEKIFGNLSFIVCFFKSRLIVILGLMEKYLSAAELA